MTDSAWARLRAALPQSPQTWLVTGAAGFIGSHLVETLLGLGQTVVGLDNFATGHRANLDDVRERVGPAAAARFRFLEGDVRDAATCAEACRGVTYVLHQAALGSVPRSINDPVTSHRVNVDGFVEMLVAARDAGVRRFVYASSSSVYGDHPVLPKREGEVGRPLSPYAVTKKANELYADVFALTYGLKVTGLRYFNVFGPRQDPQGPYAAVIPKWIGALLDGEVPVLHGDGETSRDFCYVENVASANLLAATADGPRADVEVFNIACGAQTSLRDLYGAIRDALRARGVSVPEQPQAGPFRAGDVRHSLADISAAASAIGYEALVSAAEGLAATVAWYADRAARAA